MDTKKLVMIVVTAILAALGIALYFGWDTIKAAYAKYIKKEPGEPDEPEEELVVLELSANGVTIEVEGEEGTAANVSFFTGDNVAAVGIDQPVWKNGAWYPPWNDTRTFFGAGSWTMAIGDTSQPFFVGLYSPVRNWTMRIIYNNGEVKTINDMNIEKMVKFVRLSS